MNTAGEEKKKLRLSRSTVAVLCVIGALAVFSVALSMLYRSGIALINGSLLLFLPFFIAYALMAWGAFKLYKRVQRRAARIAVLAGLGSVMFILLVLGFSYLSLMGSVTLPSQTGLVRSPDGSRTLVVLRQLDADEERMELRRAARLAEDPEGDPELTYADYGYLYAAYPRVAHFFYDVRVEAEGELHMGYESQATLMVEWLDDDTRARFFIENPEPGDEGEWIVSLEK